MDEFMKLDGDTFEDYMKYMNWLEEKYPDIAKEIEKGMTESESIVKLGNDI